MKHLILPAVLLAGCAEAQSPASSPASPQSSGGRVLSRRKFPQTCPSALRGSLWTASSRNSRIKSRARQTQRKRSGGLKSCSPFSTAVSIGTARFTDIGYWCGNSASARKTRLGGMKPLPNSTRISRRRMWQASSQISAVPHAGRGSGLMGGLGAAINGRAARI